MELTSGSIMLFQSNLKKLANWGMALMKGTILLGYLHFLIQSKV
jgi:hypothetical protein